MDPLGNVPLFLSLMKDIRPKRQRFIICRELLIALAIIVSFYFIGDTLLKVLHLSEHTIMISGGIILFLIAIKMIFPTKAEYEAHAQHKEPFIVPLAVPLVAGPAVLAAVIIYSRENIRPLATLLAILIAWFASLLLLLSSQLLQKVLGSKGLTACERLMGLLLTLIAVQMFLEGFAKYRTSLAT